MLVVFSERNNSGRDPACGGWGGEGGRIHGGGGRVERIQPADGTTEGTVCTPVKMLINGKLSFICINLPDMRSVWNIFFRKH